MSQHPKSQPVALVTGSAGGLGFAAAERLRDEGFRVHVVWRSSEARVPELEQGFAGRVHRADLCEVGAAARLVEAVLVLVDKEGRRIGDKTGSTQVVEDAAGLVATTVVEVGVDVPNATLMVVHQAERFGLSQLHQLRGRIGRGSYQGYCFLLAGRQDESAEARLEVLDQHADGFSVAEADFLLRGPGDVLGVRQHGELPLRVADLIADRELLEETRTIAFDLVRTGEIDGEEASLLHLRVLERFGELMELPRTG